MIDTDESGQKKLSELAKYIDDDFWTEWENDFLTSNSNRAYKDLQPKQKTTVGTLYDKMMRQ